MMDPLYRRLLGDRFDILPAPIRRMHDRPGAMIAKGSCEVSWGKSWIGRLAMRLLRMPRPGRDLPLEVRFFPECGGERWERHFPGTTFRTVLRPGEGRHRGLFRERMGAVVGTVRLRADAAGLDYEVLETRLLGIRIPLRSSARETAENGVFAFSVELSLPGLGRLIRYAGTLAAPVEASQIR